MEVVVTLDEIDLDKFYNNNFIKKMYRKYMNMKRIE